jgi:uncharacterized membrane protein affecting hemolysin expression
MRAAAHHAKKLLGILVLSGVLGLTGCAQSFEELAEETAEGAAGAGIEQTLSELDQPENRRILNQLMALPGVADFGELLSRGVVRGMAAGLSEELRPEQVEAFVRTVMDGVEPALARAVRGDLGDSLEELAARMVDAAFDEALTPERRQQVVSLARVLARATTNAVMQVLSEQIRQQLAPALQAMIRDDVAPAVAEAMRQQIGPAVTDMLNQPKFRQSLADSAQILGKNLVLGTNQGLLELRAEDPEDDTLLETLQRTISQGEQTLQTVLWMLGVAVLVLLLLVIVLGLGLWRAVAKSGELIEESKVREESISDMAQAVSAAEEED